MAINLALVSLAAFAVLLGGAMFAYGIIRNSVIIGGVGWVLAMAVAVLIFAAGMGHI